MNNVDEQIKAFSKELQLLMEWEEQESNKIIARLKKENKILGLDGYNEEFSNIRQERNRRLEKLYETYGKLPIGTKLKL